MILDLIQNLMSTFQDAEMIGYAAREAAARDLESFVGGATVIITAPLLVLLIILIILL